MTAPLFDPISMSPDEQQAIAAVAEAISAEPFEDGKLRALAILDVLRRTVGDSRSLARAKRLVNAATAPAQLADVLRALAG